MSAPCAGKRLKRPSWRLCPDAADHGSPRGELPSPHSVGFGPILAGPKMTLLMTILGCGKLCGKLLADRASRARGNTAPTGLFLVISLLTYQGDYCKYQSYAAPEDISRYGNNDIWYLAEKWGYHPATIHALLRRHDQFVVLEALRRIEASTPHSPAYLGGICRRVATEGGDNQQ